jgi:protein subunit release factor A
MPGQLTDWSAYLKYTTTTTATSTTTTTTCILNRWDNHFYGRDSASDKDVIVEVRAGTGGVEAAIFAHDIFRMYQVAVPIY